MPADRSFPPALQNIALQTERLTLRPFQTGDAPSILALFTDKGFMAFACAPMFRSIEEAHVLIAKDAAKRATGERLRLGIERMDDGALIGYCDLFNIDRDCSKAELGYGLLTAQRGCGYMNEALSALLNWAFNDLLLNRIMADINPANTNSEKTLARLGFSKEGQFRDNCIIDGAVSDSVFYTLQMRDEAQCSALPAAGVAPPLGDTVD